MTGPLESPAQITDEDKSEEQVDGVERAADPAAEADPPARDQPADQRAEPHGPLGIRRVWRWYKSKSEPVRIMIATLAATAVINSPILVSAAADWKVAFGDDGPDVIVQQPAPLPAGSGAAPEEQCQSLVARTAGTGGPEVGVYVRVPGGCWSQILGFVPPASDLEYQVSYVNGSDEQHDDVTFRVDLPDGMRLVAGSTRFMNASHPDGERTRADNIDDEGVNLGSYSPGSNAWVTFRVSIPDEGEAPCGATEYHVTGTAGPWGSDAQSNTAVLSSYRSC